MKRKDQREDTRLVAIRAAIEPVLAAHAVELGDLAWFQEPGGLTLRLTIERPLPEGEVWRPELGFGVNLDDCAKVSRAVSALLDGDPADGLDGDPADGLDGDPADGAEGDPAAAVAPASALPPDLLPEAYLLEVSSPGLDRPLFGARDFVRFRGALAKVKLAKPASDGQRVLRGVIEEANAGSIAMTVDGKRFEVLLEDVESANLVFELAAEPKRAPKATKAAPKKGAPRKGAAQSSAGSSDSKNDTTVPDPGAAKGSIRRAG